MYGIYEDGRVIAKFIAPLGVKSNNPIKVSDTLSLKRQISRGTAQRWEIETAVEYLSHGAEDLFVNLVINGYSENITVLMPQNYGASLRNTTTVNPNAAASAGSNVIAVTGNDGTIPKGTFIRFSGVDTKVYMVTEDLTGDGNMYIYPNLRLDLNGTFTHRKDVLMLGLYDTDTVIGMTYTDGILMDIGTIRIVEKVT